MGSGVKKYKKIRGDGEAGITGKEDDEKEETQTKGKEDKDDLS
jgi:hypothetical protein